MSSQLTYVEKEFLSQVKNRENIFETPLDKQLFFRLPLTPKQQIQILTDDGESKTQSSSCSSCSLQDSLCSLQSSKDLEEKSLKETQEDCC